MDALLSGYWVTDNSLDEHQRAEVRVLNLGRTPWQEPGEHRRTAAAAAAEAKLPGVFVERPHVKRHLTARVT